MRARILKQNGIRTRHYAIDRDQRTLFSNAEMAARAVRDAMAHAALEPAEIDFLAAATSQGDFPLPGFASIVLAETWAPPCEIATLYGVCASGVMAVKSAMLQVQSGGKKTGVACASEFASQLFKATRFELRRRLAPGVYARIRLSAALARACGRLHMRSSFSSNKGSEWTCQLARHERCIR